MFLLLVAIALQAPPAAKDAPTLEGRWSLAAAHSNGRDLPEGALARVRLIVVADEMVIYTADGKTSRLVFKLDPKATPNAIDLSGIAGLDQGKELKGIYELNADRLKVCRTLNPAIARPTAYAAEAGSKCVIEEWQREKDDYAIGEDRLRLLGRWRVAESKNTDPKVRLRDLDFADPMLSVTHEGGAALGFLSAPWKIEGEGSARKVSGAPGDFTYKFDKGQLVVEFADGQFKGSWTLKKTRGL
jgi:uncharacterized protein (TIGR03067 family)